MADYREQQNKQRVGSAFLQAFYFSICRRQVSSNFTLSFELNSRTMHTEAGVSGRTLLYGPTFARC
jgi:hypothetical protein